jgi:hypothetical protein
MTERGIVTKQPLGHLMWRVALPVVLVGLALAGVCYFFQPDKPENRPAESTPAPQFFSVKNLLNGTDGGPLRCRLTPWPGSDHGKATPDLCFVLTNTTTQPVSFWYLTHPHFQVTFRVRDLNSIVLTSFDCNSLASTALRLDPTGKNDPSIPVHTLNAGQSYTAGFYFSALEEYLEVPTGAGHYRLEASFASGGHVGADGPTRLLLTVSQPILIDVAAKAPGELRAKWRLILE